MGLTTDLTDHTDDTDLKKLFKFCWAFVSDPRDPLQLAKSVVIIRRMLRHSVPTESLFLKKPRDACFAIVGEASDHIRIDARFDRGIECQSIHVIEQLF